MGKTGRSGAMEGYMACVLKFTVLTEPTQSQNLTSEIFFLFHKKNNSKYLLNSILLRSELKVLGVYNTLLKLHTISKAGL